MIKKKKKNSDYFLRFFCTHQWPALLETASRRIFITHYILIHIDVPTFSLLLYSPKQLLIIYIEMNGFHVSFDVTHTFISPGGLQSTCSITAAFIWGAGKLCWPNTRNVIVYNCSLLFTNKDFGHPIPAIKFKGQFLMFETQSSFKGV